MGQERNADPCGHCETPLAIALASGHNEVAKILAQKEPPTKSSERDSKCGSRPSLSAEARMLPIRNRVGPQRGTGEIIAPRNERLHVILHYTP